MMGSAGPGNLTIQRSPSADQLALPRNFRPLALVLASSQRLPVTRGDARSVSSNDLALLVDIHLLQVIEELAELLALVAGLLGWRLVHVVLQS